MDMHKEDAESLNLKSHWFAAGLSSAMARFIPVPLVDSVIDERAKRYAISKTLERYGCSYDEEKLPELYGGERGVVGWFFKKATKIPMKLLLYPLRKIAKVVTATTGIPKDFSHTFLLARAVDQSIQLGILKKDMPDADLKKVGGEIRLAFDKAFDEMDSIIFSVVSSVIKQETRELKPAVAKAILKITGRSLRESELDKESKAMSAALERKEETELDHKDKVSLGDLVHLVEKFDKQFVAKVNDSKVLQNMQQH